MKINKKILALSLTLIILIIIPVSSAYELNESQAISSSENTDILTDKYDAVYVDADSSTDGDGHADNPAKSISKALDSVKDGGTIYLKGTFTGLDNTNITLDSQPDNIKFIGTAAVIDGEFKNSFAVVKSGTYSFRNISFINNYKSGEGNQFGGVIYNIDGRLTVTDCIFENNTLLGVNRANGGAISSDGYLKVENCNFINNSVSNTNSSGDRKNAADGGAISNLGKLYVSNTNFISNKALRNGGAIRTQDGGYANFTYCNFTDNSAAYHKSGGTFGGAIYSWDCALDVYYCIFKNNRINDTSGYGAQGGAISSDRGAGKINILYSQFINNTAAGTSSVSGQSIYFGGISGNVNYCTIDTGIYSASSTTNFDYNLWDSNDFNNLIELLPQSASVKYYADLEVYSNAGKLEEGETIDIFVDLFWNGTTRKDNINLIPTQEVILTSNCGNLIADKGILNNGHFETKILLNDTTDPVITARISNIISYIDFTQIIKNANLSVSFDNAFEDENVVITVLSEKYLRGICLVDVDDSKYYVELEDGKSILYISNLNIGTHSVRVRYLGGDNETYNGKLVISQKINPLMNISIYYSKNPCITVELPPDASGNLTVVSDGSTITTVPAKTPQIELAGLGNGMHSVEVIYSGDKIYSKQIKSIIVSDKPDTAIIIKSKITLSAADTKAGEKFGVFTFTLKDANGKVLSDRKVQVAINGKIYSITTDKSGVGSVNANINTANTYTCALTFSGDEKYNACPLTLCKLTVTKKKTSIKADFKKIKAKSKTKIRVTLKTVKNNINGKTYLYKGKKLTLKVNGKTYSAKTDKKGTATFTLKLNKKGKYPVRINFAGDETYKSSAKSVKLTVY